MSDQELMLLAEKARENAYVPYSNFKVGAALLCSDGSVYLGCNVENASYGATMCAERTAVFSAIADGKRAFLKIAVCGGNDHADVPCPPCGICRQVLREFTESTFRVIMKNGDAVLSYTIGELLPLFFQKSTLDG